MGTVPSNNYTFDLLVEADDHAWAPAVADNGPGKEDIGAAGFAPGVVEELPGHGVVDAKLAVRNAAARHEAVRQDLMYMTR